MTRQSYYPTRQAEQAVWLENFRLKLPSLAPALAVPAARVTEAVADARWLVHLLVTWLEAVRTHGRAATGALEQAQTGSGDGLLVLPAFTSPPLPAGVAVRPAGSLRRIFQLVAELRENAAITPAVRADLGIEGRGETAPDFDTVRPKIAATLTAAGVRVDWGWQGWAKFLDQCEIQVDRGDGQGWRVLTFDTTPGYLDTTPLPAVLTRWKYRAIYRVDDAPVGGWSAEAAVTPGGG